MQPVKIVIVGGVAGGASAAAKARRTNEQAEIILFERGAFVSFANCGLPYYIGEEITDRSNLLLQTPESFWKRFRVDVRVRHEVTDIRREDKKVVVKNLDTGEVREESYDRLILAPGAGAIVPPLPGIWADNVFTVKTVPSSDRVKQFVQRHRPRRAVVVGAGFIGLESAEALKRQGVEVTMVEMQPQVLPPLDADMAHLVAHHLQEAGLKLVPSDGISGFATREQEGRTLAYEVELQSGRRLPCDVVILSIGVRPELKLAREAGLRIGEAGGIAVNERQQTSDPDIYAAGDAVEVKHLVTGRPTRIPLAGPANKQGRVAGANAAGGDLTFPGALGTSIVGSLGITAGRTGLSEREAKAHGFDVQVSVIHSLDHAGYYPGAALLHLKLISDRKTGRVLGAQAVGEQGVDKRIDVLATAITADMTVEDLEDLDLAYAPQFSSAKDPVILAGFVGANTLRGEVEMITCPELQEKMANGDPIQLLDVRNPEEYALRHLPHAHLIPVDELRERLHELDPERETVVYCRVGLRGYLASRILMQSGFHQVSNLTGGILICDEQGVKVEQRPAANPAVSAPESVGEAIHRR